MADTSNSLSLPFIQPSQAQKHVTHNEALQILDVLTQLAVTSDEISTPPVSPSDGARYIVGVAGTGDWNGHDGEIAVFDSGNWRFFVPRAGWRAFVLNRETLVAFDGTDWIDLDTDELQDVVRFGLGMETPAGTPFAAKLNSSLWTALYQADGGDGDLVQTLNRETQNNDAGFVFQTDFGSRAIFGLFGSSNVRLAVSPDGTTFFDGFDVEPSSGIVNQPNLPRFKASTNFDNFCALDTWTRIALNDTEFNDQNIFDPGTNLFTAPTEGTYAFGASLVYKQNVSTAAMTKCRLLKNGADVISGSQISDTSPHISEETTLCVHNLVSLEAGDTVELEGYIAGSDGYFMADRTVLWGHKVG